MKRSHGGSSSAALSMMNTRLHVELDAAALFAIEQIERRPLRQIQERGVLEIALDLVVRPSARRLRIVGQVLVERLIVLVRELGFGPRPKRLRLIHRLLGAPPS